MRISLHFQRDESIPMIHWPMAWPYHVQHLFIAQGTYKENDGIWGFCQQLKIADSFWRIDTGGVLKNIEPRREDYDWYKLVCPWGLQKGNRQQIEGNSRQTHPRVKTWLVLNWCFISFYLCCMRAVSKKTHHLEDFGCVRCVEEKRKTTCNTHLYKYRMYIHIICNIYIYICIHKLYITYTFMYCIYIYMYIYM